MYAGHAAVALALKAREPRTPLVPLMLACYGPDWVEVSLMIPHPREGMAPYSHSLPAVLAGAVLASALYAAVARGPGAVQILIGWLLHWPADLLTGLKPIVGLTPLIGVDLYRLPAADFALEAVVIILCCAVYARRFAESPPQRWLVVAMGGMLMALQLGLDVVIARTDPAPWKPSLALRVWQPHLHPAAELRTSLAQNPGTSTVGARWRRKNRLR